jgi:cation transport ATPase
MKEKWNAINGKNHLLFLCAFIFMLSSCTIEKRRHMSGYHIERLGHNQPDNKLTEHQEKETDVKEERQQSKASKEMECATNQYAIELSTPSSENFTDSTEHKHSAIQKKDKQSWHEGVKLKQILTHPASTTIGNFISPNADNLEQDERPTSLLGSISIALAILALVLFLTALLILEGWTSLGYAVLAFMAAALAFLVGIFAIIFARKNDRKLPLLFYPLFILTGIVSIWIAILIVFK